jgi:hypothetical protein
MKFYGMTALIISISFFSSSVVHCAAQKDEAPIKILLWCGDVRSPEESFELPVLSQQRLIGLDVKKAVA